MPTVRPSLQAPAVDSSALAGVIERRSRRTDRMLGQQVYDPLAPSAPWDLEVLEPFAPEQVTETSIEYGEVPGGGRSILGAPPGSIPVSGDISQAYGIPGDYASGRHNGLDIAAPVGSKVTSPIKGTVIAVGYEGDYGLRVMVRQADGTYGFYAHLEDTWVGVGQQIKAGTVVGTVGLTGNTTGAHLHWEVRNSTSYGDTRNPMDWLRGV